jgi:hypothetical protein
MANTFADRIGKAASDFPGATSTAWVQYLVDKDGKTVKVRMQAPEIFKQFDGSVKFGTGRLPHGGPYVASFSHFFQTRRVFCFSERKVISISSVKSRSGMQVTLCLGPL